MKTVLTDEFVDGLLARGEARILLRILAARGLPVTSEVRDLVTDCVDTDRLEAWADRAVTASSVEEIFGADVAEA